MTQDPLQVERNIQEFKRRRKRQLMMSIPVVALLLISFWVRDHPDRIPFALSQNAFLTVFLAAIAFVLVFSLKNWRCPTCDRYLGKGISPRFCPKCGAQLQ